MTAARDPGGELMRSNARLRSLVEVSRAFAEAEPDERALSQAIARALAEHIGDACAVLLRDAEGSGSRKVADAHRDPLAEAECRALEAELGAYTIGEIGARAVAAEVQPDAFVARVDERFKALAARLDVHGFAVVPMRARGVILGSVALVRCRAGASYAAEDLALLQELADRAGLALDNVRQLEAAHAHAIGALIDGLPDAVVSTDAEGSIRGWNVRAEHIFGWSAHEMLGRSAREVLGFDPMESAERSLRRKDGTQARVFVSAMPNGPGGAMVSILREIREQHQDEEAARQLAALVEATDDAIQRLTPDGIIQNWNRGSERLFGYTAAEAIGQHIAIIVGTKTATQDDMIARLKRGERIQPFEAIRKRKDGSTVEIAVTVSPVFDDTGRVTAIAGFARDISERRKLEQQLLSAERMASVGMLAAGIAHEINNPLTYVLGNLDVVLAELAHTPYGSSAAQVREQVNMLKDARDGAERIARIVRGLKAFCRTEVEPRVSLALPRVLETALRLADNELKHCARVVKDYGETPPVIGDEGALVQVFVNLLINAAHALPDERREQNEIRIRTRCDARGRAVVEVCDTGTGIPDAIRGKIFEPFVTTKSAGKGSGLGLSICQRIVTAHDGEIGFESRDSEGTTFRVTLPAAQVAPVVASSAPEASTDGPGLRGTILVVDDEPLVGDLLAKILSEHAVVVCRSGRAAMDCIEAGERFDGILCDLMMPGLTGMDVYAAIKALAPDQAERMVFLTGGTFTPASRTFLESISNPCLGKPFNAKDVRALVRQLVQSS